MSLGSMWHSFWNPQEGYKEAGNELEKYYNQGQGYLDPYNQNGQNMFGKLMNQSNELGDPAALQAKWSQGYSESPYAQQLTNNATQAGMDAASSMGMMGSSPAIQNIQTSSGNIMQSDRQQYMNDLMDKYMKSVGINQGVYNTGAGAAGQMSQNAMSQGQGMASSKYNEANAPGNLFGNLLGAGANFALDASTGGLSGIARGLMGGGGNRSVNSMNRGGNSYGNGYY